MQKKTLSAIVAVLAVAVIVAAGFYFKKHTGMSPLAYFNRLKIERACQLLKDTDLKVNQICLKLGIDDQYYFSRLFSKTMGISPTAYRETVHVN